MDLHAPNIALFVISGCLAMIGVMASLPIELPIPGIVADNSALYHPDGAQIASPPLEHFSAKGLRAA
jgi:hypothetical protein